MSTFNRRKSSFKLCNVSILFIIGWLFCEKITPKNLDAIFSNLILSGGIAVITSNVCVCVEFMQSDMILHAFHCKGFQEKMYTVVVFLDITAACDNVAIDNLIRSMNMKGAPRKICWILWNLLRSPPRYKLTPIQSTIISTNGKSSSTSKKLKQSSLPKEENLNYQETT